MPSKHKAKKRSQRRKRLKRQGNIKRNNSKAPAPYVLYVDVPEQGWKPMMTFRKQEEVDAYVEQQEEIRRKNTSHIVEGYIKDRRSGRVIARIKPHKMEGTEILEKSEE
jgi:hypothetical protein